MHARLVIVQLAWLSLSILLASPTQAEDTPASKPNVIFILFDDLGYGQPPSYRSESQFKMPNLDKLAADGMRFTDAHTASAVCTPTRYGALTGRYPWRIGQFGVLQTYSPPIIERDRLTVGAMLQQHGYHTACIGKWHLGMDWQMVSKKQEDDSLPIGSVAVDGPTTRGFDYFCGYTHARNMGMVMEQDKVAQNLTAVEVQPLLARKAVDYLDERAKAGTPFFLYLPLSTPHTPIVPAPKYAGKSNAKAYGDWIFQGDAVVGEIRDALDRLKLANNTLVIVSSDNGAAQRAYPPLRDSKGSIWEGGHRVPYIACWPGKIKSGTVCDDTICLNDLFATCAEIVGAKLPGNAAEDSVSILPNLLGAATVPIREATVHQSHHGDLAIRQGPWKLIFLGKGKQELYNLQDDLSETKDLFSSQPEVVARLTKVMQQYIDTGRSTPGEPQKNSVKVELGLTASAKREGGR